MKRFRLNRRADKAFFKRTANSTRTANIYTTGYRGGTRL